MAHGWWCAIAPLGRAFLTTMPMDYDAPLFTNIMGND